MTTLIFATVAVLVTAWCAWRGDYSGTDPDADDWSSS